MAKENAAAAVPQEYFDAAKLHGHKFIYLIEGHHEPVFEWQHFAKLKEEQGAAVIKVPVK